MRGPFAAGANELVAAGWRGVLPLPENAKYPPPTGYTGAGGAWPSGADVWSWSEELGHGNVALRLPPGVIGLDVDAYGGKAGAATLDAREQLWGPLPPTWLVTSRDDGISGIRLYRVPPGLWWPGELGGGIEVIQTRHRYVVAPPSIHPEGRTYRWVHGDPDIDAYGLKPPTPDGLSPLPDAWISGLSGGRTSVDIAKSAPAGAAVAEWYIAPANNEPACGLVRTTVAKTLTELNTPIGSRHDIGMRAVMRLAYLSAEGHRGCVPAIEQVRRAWTRAITTGTSARDDESAAAEWRRIMSGALSILGADGGLEPNDLTDPCANPFAGILLPENRGDERRPDAYAYDPATGQLRAPEGYAVGPDAPDRVTDAEQVKLTAKLIEIEAAKLRIRRAARELLDEQDARRAWIVPPSTDTLTDELALPDDDLTYRVADLIPTGANVVVTAMFKTGKTTLVNDLVRSIADGEPFLGRYDVERLTEGTLALWNYEVSSGQYRRWLRDLGIANTNAVTVLNLRGFTMPVRSSYVMSWAVDWLTKRNVKIWVVDPFARAFLGNGESENSNTDVGLYLETLDRIKEQAGISELVLPTHTGRATMEPGAERSRGASRLDDWADVRFILTKDDEGNRYFRASGRDVETPEGRLDYDPVMRKLTITDEPRPEREPERPTRGRPTDVTAQDIRDAALTIIGLHPGVGLKGVRDYLRSQHGVCSNHRLDDALYGLRIEGLISVREGGPGRPTTHYPAVEKL